MKTRVRLCGALLLLVGCSALSAAAGLRSEIESANARFSSLVAEGDGAALANLYAKDGAVMPAGSEPIRGTQAIAQFWQKGLASGISAIELKTTEIYGQGATATEVGEYALRDKAGKTIDRGKYIVIWRHQGGEWKLLRDMFSTNLPGGKG